MPAPAQAAKARIDLARYELSLDGHRVKLERQPMELLIFFAERQGRLVTREEIIQRLWGNDVFVDADTSINAAVRKIRAALGDDSAAPRFLETVVGKGYRLVGAVELTAVPVDVSAPAPAEAELASTLAPKRGRTFSRMALMVGVLAIVGFGIWAVAGRQRTRRLPESQIRSIAVLPLQNLSGDPEQEYFADGMTDELISDLSGISALRVISRTSVMQYKNVRKSLRDIGHDLNVDAVVEGTVEQSGGRVRISAQLIQVSTDSHLWAKSYERDLGDVLSLQDEVAGTIADEIRVQLSPSERERLTSVKPINPEAHEAYLRGLYHLYKRNQRDLEQSTEYFQRAIELDPRYALAYAGLADSYALRGSFVYMVLAPRDAMPKSKAAAMKALEIDPNLAEARATLAYVETLYDWDWSKAEGDFQRAIKLNPSYAKARLWYAMYLAARGRHDESLAEVRRAHELDPLSLITSNTIGLMFYLAGRYDPAIDQFHKVLEFDPNFFVTHWQLGLAYEHKGMFAEARSEFEKAQALSPDNTAILESLGEIDALTGRKQAATSALRQLVRLSEKEFVSPYVIAELNFAMGDSDHAFERLNAAYDQSDNYLILLNVDPAFRSAHSDPRFQALLRKIGLQA